MATAKFELLLDGMRHDGRDYVKGDVVELDEERGAELVALGALKPVQEKTSRTRGKADAGSSTPAES